MELHEPSGRHTLGLLLALSTMLLWGMLPHGLTLALRELDAVTITWFRFGFSAVFLGSWLGWSRRLPRLGMLDRNGRLLLGVATAGLAANYLGYVVGLDLTTPANAQVLIQAAPLLLALGGLVVFRERFTRAQWIGFGVLISGIGLFFASQLGTLASEIDRYLRGVATIGFAALTWAVYGLAQKQLLRTFSSQQILMCIYTGCFLAFSFGAHPDSLLALSPIGWASLVFAALNTLGAYGCFAAALEHWPASRVSAVLALTPLATLAVGVLATGAAPRLVEREYVSTTSILGAVIVVLGSMGVSLAGRSPAASR